MNRYLCNGLSIFAAMKYRILNKEELEIFDEDFKYFLIANGVSNEEWIEMNTSDQDRAIDLVELFSDTVLQKVYEKVKFIEHRGKSACLVFKLNDENIEMISLNSQEENLDLSTPESIHDALLNHTDSLSTFRSSKDYAKKREEEIHDMLVQGCFNSSEVFWILLDKVVSNK